MMKPIRDLEIGVGHYPHPAITPVEERPTDREGIKEKLKVLGSEIVSRDPKTAPANRDSESHQLYKTISAKDLSLLSTAFTIATFMIALDGSILCKLVVTVQEHC
jgi:hypothetical protein